jgi:CpXC protein
MSLKKPVEFSCPRCHQTVAGMIWESINFDLDPIVHDVLDGSFRNVTCTNCGTATEVDEPVLCHDMRGRFMVWYQPDGYLPDETPMPGDWLEGYRFRLVTEFHELQEKVMLLLLGFDDRSVECFKAYMERKDRKNRIPKGSTVVVVGFDPPAPAETYETVILDCLTPEGEVVRASFPFRLLQNVHQNIHLLADVIDKNEPPPRWRKVDMAYGRRVNFSERP